MIAVICTVANVVYERWTIITATYDIYMRCKKRYTSSSPAPMKSYAYDFKAGIVPGLISERDLRRA